MAEESKVPAIELYISSNVWNVEAGAAGGVREPANVIVTREATDKSTVKPGFKNRPDLCDVKDFLCPEIEKTLSNFDIQFCNFLHY